MANLLDTIGQILLPKGKVAKGGISGTPTFTPARSLQTTPAYQDHLVDLYNSRNANDSRALLNKLVNQDPDVSAAVQAYLTTAEATDLVLYAYDANNQIDPVGIAQAQNLLNLLTVTNDYTQGFMIKPTLNSIVSDMRYMMLLRGSIGIELVLDKTYTPSELRQVDMATLRWQQPLSGVYKPEQRIPAVADWVSLDIPTFFYGSYHQNPTDIFTYSLFVAAINTIAARTEVINELYRIMKVVGYPRLDVSVVEDVLLANAPPALRTDQNAIRTFVRQEMSRISSTLSGLSSEQAFVHSNAIDAKIINDKNPGAGLQIQGVIDVLDAQNQAALKVMPTVIGKSDNATTASTEARLFALSADALNRSIAGVISKFLTFGTRLAGYQGRIEAKFRPIELRPALELEPQLMLKSKRLQGELSLGTITDVEYHLEMFGRPPPEGAPQLSGTGFVEASNVTEVETGTAGGTEPNSSDTSLGKALTPKGSKAAKSNGVK